MSNYYSNAAQANEQQWNQQGNQNQQQMQQNRQNYAEMFNNYSAQSAQSQQGNNANLGYSPQQQQQIMGGDYSSGLYGAPQMSAQQYNNLMIPQDVQDRMSGNPYAPAQTAQANNATLGTAMTQNSAAIQNQYGQAQQNLNASVNPAAFNLTPGYQQAISGALSEEQSGLAGATQNPNLGLSNQFQQQYQFTPQDQQNVVTNAGNTVGAQYQSSIDQLQRNAAQSGNSSPLAIAAAQSGMLQSEAGQAANAMTAAQIQAKNEQLGVAQTAEQMRLGTAQDISSRQMQGSEALAGSQIGAANTEQQLALQGAQAGQGLALSATGLGAQLGVSGAENIANLQNQAIESATGTNLQAGEYGQTQNFNQGFGLAQNQQQMELQGQNQLFNQGYLANQALSGRAATLAGANLQQNELVSQQLAQQQNEMLGAGLTNQGQELQNYGTQGQLTNQALMQAYQMQNPQLWQQLAGAGIGFLGGMGSMFGV